MKRREAREQAFCLVFEKYFSDEPLPEIIELAKEARDQETDAYAQKVAQGVIEHQEAIDAIIEKNATGWKMNRISRVSLAILRVAVYEIQCADDVPTSVAINEAIELCKKFASEDDGAFVNGILGAFARSMDKPTE